MYTVKVNSGKNVLEKKLQLTHMVGISLINKIDPLRTSAPKVFSTNLSEI